MYCKPVALPQSTDCINPNILFSLTQHTHTLEYLPPLPVLQLQREHHLEGLQPHDHQHGPRGGVRGRRHRALPPSHHSHQQSARPEGGLLPQQPAQRHQPPGHLPRIPYRHLFSGVQGRAARQVQELEGAAGQLPHQTLLHLQHAHHPAVRAGVQPLLHLTGRGGGGGDGYFFCISTFLPLASVPGSTVACYNFLLSL